MKGGLKGQNLSENVNDNKDGHIIVNAMTLRSCILAFFWTFKLTEFEDNICLLFRFFFFETKIIIIKIKHSNNFYLRSHFEWAEMWKLDFFFISKHEINEIQRKTN